MRRRLPAHRRRRTARRPLRRADGALAARHPAAGRAVARRGRRALRLDRRRRRRGSARLEALGVTGVITNDPRLFARRPGSRAQRDRAGRGAEAGRVGARPCRAVPGLGDRARSRRTTLAGARHWNETTPRSTCAPPAAGGLKREASGRRRCSRAAPRADAAPARVRAAPRRAPRGRRRRRYWTRKRMYMRGAAAEARHRAADADLVGCAAVSQTLIVAHSSGDARPRRRAGRQRRATASSRIGSDAAHLQPEQPSRALVAEFAATRSRVMDRAARRSTDVTSTLTARAPIRTSSPALDFEALYRAARDDVYAYVATLLRDRAAAEDVTAPAFERAYRKQRTFDARARHRAGVAVRHRPQRRARRAAPAQARRRAGRRAGRRRRRAAPRTPPRPRCAAPPCAPRWPRSTRATASSSR